MVCGKPTDLLLFDYTGRSAASRPHKPRQGASISPHIHSGPMHLQEAYLLPLANWARPEQLVPAAPFQVCQCS